MTHILISNVGSRDVKLAVGGVEEDIKPPRSRGEAIWQDYEIHRPLLRFPMLAKAIDHILAEGGQVDKVYLVATDQPPPPATLDKYWQSDTIYFAHIVERWLAETYGIDPAGVEVLRLQDDPSDYAALHGFFEEELAKIKARHDDSAVYHLEISGGTPAMTSMLLVCAADAFGPMARPLYVKENRSSPYPMEIGSKLYLIALRQSLRNDVKVYAYDAAQATIDANRDFLAEKWPEALTIVRPLCLYALHRRNFDFANADKALLELTDLDLVAQLRDSLPDVAEDIDLLAEGIYNADLSFERHALLDFAMRIFQFEEAWLRYICLQRGAQFEQDGRPSKTGNKIAPAWLEENPDWIAYFTEKEVRGIEKRNVYVNRHTLGLLANGQLAKDAPQKRWTEQLGQLAKVGDLRNKAIHAYEPLELATIDAAYGAGQATDILPHIKTIWEEMAHTPFPANPFRQVNEILTTLL